MRQESKQHRGKILLTTALCDILIPVRDDLPICLTSVVCPSPPPSGLPQTSTWQPLSASTRVTTGKSHPGERSQWSISFVSSFFCLCALHIYWPSQSISSSLTICFTNAVRRNHHVWLRSTNATQQNQSIKPQIYLLLIISFHVSCSWSHKLWVSPTHLQEQWTRVRGSIRMWQGQGSVGKSGVTIMVESFKDKLIDQRLCASVQFVMSLHRDEYACKNCWCQISTN